MGLKSVLRERFHEFGDKTSLAGLNNAVHSKSNGKNCFTFGAYVTECTTKSRFFFHKNNFGDTFDLPCSDLSKLSQVTKI